MAARSGFINEYRIADTYVHISVNDANELYAEIHSAMGEIIVYDMYEIAATMQAHKDDKQALDMLLMYLSSGTTPQTRNHEMFAELAYYISNF